MGKLRNAIIISIIAGFIIASAALVINMGSYMRGSVYYIPFGWITHKVVTNVELGKAGNPRICPTVVIGENRGLPFIVFSSFGSCGEVTEKSINPAAFIFDWMIYALPLFFVNRVIARQSTG